MQNTAELDSAVGSTPWSLTSRWNAHCGVFWESWYPWLRGMMHTGELGSAVGCTPRNFKWVSFIGFWIESEVHQVFCIINNSTSISSATGSMESAGRRPGGTSDPWSTIYIRQIRNKVYGSDQEWGRGPGDSSGPWSTSAKSETRSTAVTKSEGGREEIHQVHVPHLPVQQQHPYQGWRVREGSQKGSIIFFITLFL